MQKNRVFFVYLLLFLSVAYAQDERFIRQLLRETNPNTLLDDSKKIEGPAIKWRVKGPKYLYDINSDGNNETIQFLKHDAQDVLHIFNSKKQKVFEYKFELSGVDSSIYKINLRTLDKRTNLVVLFHYEGWAQYLNFKGRARLYFLTIDNLDLKKIHVFKGPYFWIEQEQKNDLYFQRHYKLSIQDLNKDGTKEILLKHGEISRIWLYQNNGNWLSL